MSTIRKLRCHEFVTDLSAIPAEINEKFLKNRLVGMRGLAPPRIAPYGPEPYAAANYATCPYLLTYHILYLKYIAILFIYAPSQEFQPDAFDLIFVGDFHFGGHHVHCSAARFSRASAFEL